MLTPRGRALRRSACLGAALALGVVLWASLATGARADILFSLGATGVGVLPMSVAPSAGVVIDPPAAFLEQASCPMSGVLAQIAAPGAYGGYAATTPELACTIPMTAVAAASHFVVRVPGAVRRAEDVLVFDAPIVGIQTVGTCMDGTPDACRNPAVTYPGAFGTVGLGLTATENDYVVVFPGSRILYYRFDSLSAGDWDAMRVFTRVLPPATSDVRLACVLDGDASLGSTVMLTLTLDTLGPDGAPALEVVVRVPPGLRAGALPPGCVDSMGAVACTATSLPLTPGGATYTFALSFVVEGPVTGRLASFGSGAVRDPRLANNGCTVAVGATSDGGAVGSDAGAGDVDGGVADVDASAPFDSAVPGLDGGAGAVDGEVAAMDSGAGLAGVSFRGGAGCVCRTAPSRGGLAGPTAAGLFAATAGALARRVRRRPRRR